MMAGRRTAGFWLLDAAYWIAVMAALWTAVAVWLHLADSQPFFYAAVLSVVAGGFAVVYLFIPKS